MAVARHHRLSPLLSITCGQTLPAPLAEAFRRDRVVTAARNMMLGQVAEECLRALRGGRHPHNRAQGARLRDPPLRRAWRPPHRRRRSPGPWRKAPRRLWRARSPRLRAARRRARLRRSRLSRGRLDPRRREVDLHMALAPLARCRIDYAAIWREAEPFRLGGTDTLVLARPHAAVFHALHMAIDHFDLPAIYLLDLDRLLPTIDDADRADRLARAWRCWRPLATARALVASFLEGGLEAAPSFSRRVIRMYGTTKTVVAPRAAVQETAPLRCCHGRPALHGDPVATQGAGVSRDAISPAPCPRTAGALRSNLAPRLRAAASVS